MYMCNDEEGVVSCEDSEDSDNSVSCTRDETDLYEVVCGIEF